MSQRLQPPSPHDRRRSARISRVVPLALQHEAKRITAGSLLISGHGVLLDSPEPLYSGASVVLTNLKLGTTVSAWVIRSAPGDRPDRFQLALEFLSAAPGFWGPDYSP